MDRNILIAVILSAVVLSVGLLVQNYLFGPPQLPGQAPVAQTEANSAGQNNGIAEGQNGATAVVAEGQGTANEAQIAFVQPEGSAGSERLITYEDPGFMRVVMDTRGGDIRQIYLLEHEDMGAPFEFFFGDAPLQGLTTSLGGLNASLSGSHFDPLFNFRRQGEWYEFYADVIFAGQAEPVTVIKRYRFFENEYFVEMEVEIANSLNEFVPLNHNGAAYTISIGPQIGPQFASLGTNARTDFRRFSYLDGNRRRDINNVGIGQARLLESRTAWAAINGKYFAALALQGNTGSEVYFTRSANIFTQTQEGSSVQEAGSANGSAREGHQLHLERPQIQSSRVNDRYRFYFGPKSVEQLRKYDNEQNNALGLSEQNLIRLTESSWLGFLENILKAIMAFFNRLIPNWGVSIILLTILVKLILYPLTRKSFESTARMKELGPRIAELREQYKDDNAKLSQATMELYKKEQVNPLGGCLPILLQFPFFIAMFSLFNNDFDLRGAVFIPGWIPDLSAPEYIVQFGFSIPIINWDALRLLPILFLATQLLTTKFTQAPDASQSNAQMKMMTLGMPIFFFFILYNMPSGLLLYWIFQNVISTGQQLAYNYFSKKK